MAVSAFHGYLGELFQLHCLAGGKSALRVLADSRVAGTALFVKLPRDRNFILVAELPVLAWLALGKPLGLSVLTSGEVLPS